LGRYSVRFTTSEYLRLSLPRLKRQGLLCPRGWVDLSWYRGEEVVASIKMRVELDWVDFRYSHRDRGGGEWKSEEYSVYFASTPCNFGGSRLWFLCPGQGCSRRVAILYGGSIFACRHCHNLSYESQREQPHYRALHKAQAIRGKLRGSPNMSEDFPLKPKGMHWSTYLKLSSEAEEAQSRSWPPWLLKRL
jgi:hypothetical protein